MRMVALVRVGTRKFYPRRGILRPRYEVFLEFLDRGLGFAGFPVDLREFYLEGRLSRIDPHDFLVHVPGLVRLPESLEQEAVDLQAFYVVGRAPEDFGDSVHREIQVAERAVQPGELHAESVVVRHEVDERLDFPYSLGVAAGLLEHILDVHGGGKEFRVGFQRFPEPGDGFVRLAGFRVGEPDAVPCRRVERVDRDDLRKKVNRFFMLAVLREALAVAVHGLDPARPPFHRRVVLGNRVGGLAESLVSYAEVVVEGRVVGVDGEAAPEYLHCLGIVTHGDIDAAEVVIGYHMLFVELDRLGEGHFGGLQLAERLVRVPEVEQKFSVAGFEFYRVLERGEGIQGLVEPQVGDCHAFERPYVAGIRFDCARVGCQGVGSPVRPQVDSA